MSADTPAGHGAFVLDTSATLAWCFADEETTATTDALRAALHTGVVVPSLWFLEVLNVLHIAVRRKRVTTTHAEVFLRTLAHLPIEVDSFRDARAGFALSRTLSPLAVKYALTTYGACYLELALRRRLPLATLDSRLSKAAHDLAVPLVFP